MPYFDQEPFDVRCEWGMKGIEHLSPADVIVIIDVLSFTTSVDVAVSRGASILPYRWKEESVAEYAKEHSAELAGRRGEDEFSLGPASLVNVPKGLRLVLPSQNGSTLAFAAKDRGAVVIAACLRNASAVAAWMMKEVNPSAKRVTVIAAGERWPDGSLRPAVEDWIGAGAIIKNLGGTLSPEARAAVAAFEGMRGSIKDCLMQCASGRELVERGYSGDVELAAELDVSATVPVLKEDAFVAGD